MYGQGRLAFSCAGANAHAKGADSEMTAVSIIVRTKNEAAWIGRTLEALFVQDFGDFEVIVVDSGSEDATLKIAEDFSTKILRIPPEKFTYGYALNVGANAARGDYLVALSAHAEPANRYWLSELVRPLTDARVAGSSSRQIPHPGHRLEAYLVFWRMLYVLRFRLRPVYRYLFSNASSAVRRSLWQEHPFDEKLASCEDHFWALRMQKLGHRIAYCPESIVIHSHKIPLAARLRRSWRELGALVNGYCRRGCAGNDTREES